MGALRTKMIEEMKLRNFSPRTEQSYVSAMVGLVKYYRQSPDQLTQDEIRSYLLHLKERGLSPSSRNVAISGMKFFYHQILGWDEQKLFLPPRKGSWRLPEVLSPKEVEHLLYAHGKLRDRCLLMTAYATGVRVSELVRLKVSDIDSERMMVKVEQGKGKKTATRLCQSGCSQSFAPVGKSIARQLTFSPTERAGRYRSTTPSAFTILPS
jgi:integrase/recombinase XerD